jgi:hypothetical protein
MSLCNCEFLSFLAFQIILQSHINILEKIVAAFQSLLTFLDLINPEIFYE